MVTIQTNAGDRLEDVARKLVQRAPAQAEFNGVRIRALYATTRPTDIERAYHRELEAQAIAWRASPAGKRAAADARNFAGWIVGQWLACWYPGVDMFVERWRERFLGAAS